MKGAKMSGNSRFYSKILLWLLVSSLAVSSTPAFAFSFDFWKKKPSTAATAPAATGGETQPATPPVSEPSAEEENNRENTGYTVHYGENDTTVTNAGEDTSENKKPASGKLLNTPATGAGNAVARPYTSGGANVNVRPVVVPPRVARPVTASNVHPVTAASLPPRVPQIVRASRPPVVTNPNANRPPEQPVRAPENPNRR